MRIGLISDLHLEFRQPHPSIHKKAEPGDVLLVAGDFTTANLCAHNRTDAESRKHQKLIDAVVENWFSQYKHVLYIAGNHEHYNFVFGNTVERLRQYWALDANDEPTNVTVLDNDFVDIDGVRFVGSTLWSDFMKASPVSMRDCQWGMNDFRIIHRVDPISLSYTERRDPLGTVITPDFILDRFLESKKYIRQVVKETKGPVVVMTHHGPTYKSLHSDHVGNGLDGAYASDLSDMIFECHNIKYWVHGHTHQSTKYMVGDCQVLANQCGYSFEPCFAIFEGIKQFEI